MFDPYRTPGSRLPFRANKSIAGLLNCWPCYCTVAIIHCHSLSIRKDLVTIDNSVLESVVATAFRTLFPLPNKPFCITIDGQALKEVSLNVWMWVLYRLFKKRLGWIVVIAGFIGDSLLVYSVCAEYWSRLNAFSTLNRALRPFSRLNSGFHWTYRYNLPCRWIECLHPI